MSAYTPLEQELASAGPDDRFDQPKRAGRPGRLTPELSGNITRRITALALLLGVFMAAGKLYLFSITASVGILASLVHSALDIVAAASSFVAVRIAAKVPTDDYRFGFGKAESFSAVFQVCLIGLAAFHLFGAGLEGLGAEHAHDHGGHSGHAHGVPESTIAIWALGLFCVLTVWLLVAQTWAIRATGSIAVRGDRAHYTADLLGNLFVMAGLAIATFTEAHWADAVVGLTMALWLLFTGYRVARLAWAQLMDRELNADERRLIRARVMADPKVRAISNLRTRASGPHLHMQMRLDLDPHLSLSDAHDVVIAAEQRLMSAFPAADILIHPHPAGCAQSHGNVRFSAD